MRELCPRKSSVRWKQIGRTAVSAQLADVGGDAWLSGHTPPARGAKRPERRHWEWSDTGGNLSVDFTNDADTEWDLVSRALAYLEQATGTRPVGYRAPSWHFSPNTLSIIRATGPFLVLGEPRRDDGGTSDDENPVASAVLGCITVRLP